MWMYKSDFVDFVYGEMTVDDILAEYLPAATDPLDNDQCIVVLTANHGIQVFSNTNTRGSASTVPISDVVDDCALGYWMVSFREIKSI